MNQQIVYKRINPNKTIATYNQQVMECMYTYLEHVPFRKCWNNYTKYLSDRHYWVIRQTLLGLD